MEKLKMETKNLADENYKKLAELFPNAITETIDDEGNVVRAIDKDVLMQEININVVDGEQERYQFTWPDKRKSVILANEPTTKTLRFLKDKSVSRDGSNGGADSKNIYIEGDNLDALKILQETYLGKVKMIYIDPPYNTGKDFIYKDNFEKDKATYKDSDGQYDDNGNRLITNPESNGRFHTDWLNMIYPRLVFSKNLLSNNGVIFISIDDNEQENLKKLCNEIFGEQNFVAQITWERAYSPVNMKKHFSESHDYILCYAKNITDAKCLGLPKTKDVLQRYINPDNDPRGPWKPADSTVGPAIKNKVYELTLPSGRKVLPSSGRCWLYSKEDFKKLEKDNRVWYGNDGNSIPSIKKFASEVKQTMTPMTIWKYSEVGHSQQATKELKDLFNGKSFFDYPKPVDLIKRCLQLYTEKNDIIIDFFSGSATTAQAVMQLNAEDNGKRHFIMIQLQEKTDEKSEAFESGFKTICDFGEERIRRAGKNIKEETNADIDYGFRCFKVDSSNMKDVYYNPKEYNQTNLQLFEDNIKPDRTPIDLLIQVMLDLGIMLSSKIDKVTIDNNEVFSVENGYLYACFDKNISEETVKQIALKHPFYAVFRDLGMENDSVMTNFDQIFKTYSPNTKRRVI